MDPSNLEKLKQYPNITVSFVCKQEPDDCEEANPSENSEHNNAVSSSAPSSCHNSVSNSSAVTTNSGNPGHGATPAAETLKMMAQQHQQPPVSSGAPGQYPGQYQGTPPHSNAAMTSHAPEQGTATSQPPPPHMMSAGPRPGHPQEGDPRLRAAQSARFRLGNPNSIANSMAGGMGPAQAQGGMNTMNSGHPGMMGQHQRMPMANNMMPNMSMAGNGQGPMPGNMQMMNQQQVSQSNYFPIFTLDVYRHSARFLRS